jgi:hypothetical protein
MKRFLLLISVNVASVNNYTCVDIVYYATGFLVMMSECMTLIHSLCVRCQVSLYLVPSLEFEFV